MRIHIGIGLCVLLAVLIALVYPLGGPRSDYASSAAALASIIAAAGGTGAVLGFIFGVPSPSARRAVTAAGTKDVEGDAAVVEGFSIPNTNLAQVSDWLTKILIGAGLVQVAALPAAMRSLTDFLDDSVGGPSASAVIAGSVLYGLSAGFIFGYVWTVLFFRRYFDRIEAMAREDRTRKSEQDPTAGLPAPD